jgi:predicted TIM-barrel fold metal-dependent hydrolase
MTPQDPQPTGPPPHPDPKVPDLRLPPLSCDSHCHIFGPGAIFPYAADRTFTPVDVSKDDLRRRHEHLGFERAVIVQSACHGTDHSALLDALATGEGRYRGVALVTPRTSPDEIARLHEAGVRGVRLHFLPHLGASPSTETIRSVVDLVRPFSWHVAIHVAGEGIIDLSEVIASIGLPVVIDHMARLDIRAGLGGPAVLALRRLLDGGDVWLKLSGADRVSVTGPPYADAVRPARALAAHAPERVVWGTDFPHPNIHGAMPDDGRLVDLIGEIVPDEALRHRMLVDNPAALFDFG